MANTVIALKKSGTSSAVPSALSNGEIAINYADGVLFYKHANGTIASITGGGGGSTISFGTVNASGTLLLADQVNDVLDVRAGQNIIITGDAINDRMTINADLTAANSWANTKLANTSNIFFAGNFFIPDGSTLGIGSTETTAPLTISQSGQASVSLTGALIDADGSSNSYLQVSIRNANTGAGVSTDYIATTDDGTDTTNFIDLGINGSGFSSPTWTINGRRDGYLYTVDSNLSIGGANSSSRTKFINFFVGGTLSSNEVMRIQDSTGGANVGIGRTDPSYKLDVVGSVNASSLLVNGVPVGTGAASVNVSTVGPTNNTNGTLWWNTDLGRLFIWYTDGDSNQWVEASPASGSVDVALLQSYSNATNIYATSLVTSGLIGANAWANTLYVSALQNANNDANSANAWANTKLANSTVTLAGSLTTTGQVTSNGYVYITPSDGVNEGGEIQLQAAGTYTNWSIDAYQNNARVFARSGTTVSNVNFFHSIGGGSIRVGVNKTDPLYTLDVAGTANATLVLDSKGDVRDIPLNTQAALYALSLSDTGKVISTSANVFVPNAVFSSGHTISIFNSSAVTINIIANSGVTFRLAGASNNANKLLAQNGVATIICVAANNFVLSGAGLS